MNRVVECKVLRRQEPGREPLGRSKANEPEWSSEMKGYGASQERFGASQGLPRNPFSVVWYLLVVQSYLRVRVAAVLAILLCVVYAMGMGGIVLWLLEAVSRLTGSEVAPAMVPQGVRFAVGSAWVILFTLVFVYRLFRSFVPASLMRRDVDAAQVIRAGEQLVARYRSS